MASIAYIYQPHFKTECLRVAVKSLTDPLYNYVVVTCSPSYNGVYQVPNGLLEKCDIWMNGKTPCYCIPVRECKFVITLEKMTNEKVITEVKKQQKKWFNSEVKNCDNPYKKGKPDWML